MRRNTRRSIPAHQPLARTWLAAACCAFLLASQAFALEPPYAQAQREIDVLVPFLNKPAPPKVNIGGAQLLSGLGIERSDYDDAENLISLAVYDQTKFMHEYGHAYFAFTFRDANGVLVKQHETAARVEFKKNINLYLNAKFLGRHQGANDVETVATLKSLRAALDRNLEDIMRFRDLNELFADTLTVSALNDPDAIACLGRFEADPLKDRDTAYEALRSFGGTGQYVLERRFNPLGIIMQITSQPADPYVRLTAARVYLGQLLQLPGSLEHRRRVLRAFSLAIQSIVSDPELSRSWPELSYEVANTTLIQRLQTLMKDGTVISVKPLYLGDAASVPLEIATALRSELISRCNR